MYSQKTTQGTIKRIPTKNCDEWETIFTHKDEEVQLDEMFDLLPGTDLQLNKEYKAVITITILD